MTTERRAAPRVRWLGGAPRLLLSVSLAAAVLAAPPAPPVAAAHPTVHAATGADPAAIAAAVAACRADLGSLNPNVAGSFPAGRREINWDGVPDAFSAPNNLPANFFNSNSPRGAVFSTPGTGLQVSANAAAATPIEFGNINPTYPSIFQTFSPQRLFTALGANIVDVDFFVPGSSSPAVVSGFGAVFTDVDLAGSTTLEFFDAHDKSLGVFVVPAGPSGGLSFLCVTGFKVKDKGQGGIVRVRLTSGTTAIGATVNDSGTVDVVVMDDFIYGEPQAIRVK
jgi:hypothetical protein